ncbi:hypothetical protein SAMN05216223_1042 [Actinacidiphila yanglinensis]|uniref:Uncharacterized protein n=1 Tax=Actinacidiphila yanglinensis TaxID=310779 RepID=A0A1H5YK83_9ACTN|nr:hypothetical protein SAMN05216223_1042 [Actinacidiphila yanglinensis]
MAEDGNGDRRSWQVIRQAEQGSGEPSGRVGKPGHVVLVVVARVCPGDASVLLLTLGSPLIGRPMQVRLKEAGRVRGADLPY